jgi:hypothetical protein
LPVASTQHDEQTLAAARGVKRCSERRSLITSHDEIDR